MKKIYIALLFSLTILLPTCLLANSLYFILDGSGSMWGRIDSKMKIVEAKKVLIDLMAQTPTDLPVGLTVYGHRRKGDCSDITELFPLMILDESSKKEAFGSIRAIKPMGKTPLASSLESVANNVAAKDENVTIVLISDGIETCGGDPCQMVSNIRKANIKLVFHVVGLDVDKNAAAQLGCIAKAGGGHYYTASKTEDLFTILHSLQKNVAENKEIIIQEKAPEPQKITQQVKSSSSSIRIKAKGPGKIKFDHESWLKTPKYWKLIDPETGQEKGRFSGIGLTLVPPGEYQLLWKQYEHGCSEVALAEVISVESGKTATVPLRTAIQLNLPDWAKKPKYWGLKHPETDELLASFSHLDPFLVPAGTYKLIWKQSEHGAQEVALQLVKIEADTLNTISISTAIHPVAADWVQKKPHYWGLKKKGDTTSSWAALYSGAMSPQLVPTGSYDLYYDISEHGSTDSLLGEVLVTAEILNEFQVNTGVTFVPSDGLKKPYLIEFIELNSSSEEIRKTVLQKSFGPIALKPGTYKINYRQNEHNDTTMTIVDSFELPPNALIEIEL